MCAAITMTTLNGKNGTESVVADNLVVKQNKREQWGGKTEFLLACIGNAVGLGNVWRFPYLCYKNGGGAFVIPYIILVFTIGLPLFLIELSLGQFSALGPAHLYAELCPFFKGVGLSSVVASFIVSIYYNMIIAWTIFYFVESFLGQNWQFCNQAFNTKNCVTLMDAAKNGTSNRSISAPEEFFNNFMLEKSKGLEDIGGINWKIVAVLAIAWVIVIASLIKGIQSSGKVVYFTATFPYVILVILFFRGVTLEGAFEGIKYYVIPDFTRIQDFQVWRDAAIQVFYSFGIAGGGMLTYSSYNKFNENIVLHSTLIGICDMLTSLFAGFVVFSMLGFMAHTLNKPVEEVVQGGIGLAFIVIPDGLSQMPGSVIWAALFFAMLFLLGIDSQFAGIETITTFIFDSKRRSNSEAKINKPLIVIVTCVSMFLCGIPLCTNGGIYILELLDQYAAGIPYLVIALTEILIVSYVYGISNFYNDLFCMCKWLPGFWFKAHLTVLITSLAPVLLLLLLFLDVRTLLDPNAPLKSGAYTFPTWSRSLGWVIALIPLMTIPLGSLHYLIAGKSRGLCKKIALGFQATSAYRLNANLHLNSANIDKNGCDNTGFNDDVELKY